MQKSVAVLLYDELCVFEFACVTEVFGLKRPEMGANWYSYQTVSLDGKPVATQYNGQMTPDCALTDLHQLDLLIVAGWQGIDREVPPALVAELQRLFAKGTRIMSVCSGVTVLAESGLLDGLEATSHWAYAEPLSVRFPNVRFSAGALFVDNGQILTSAGSAAGLDLCLHIVRQDYGYEAANKVAKRLVIPPLREGNQAQYIQRPVPINAKTAIAPVLERLQQDLSQQVDNASLAAILNMSERTFLRRFKEATGTTPREWLTEARIHEAKTLLENGSQSVDVIADKVGFGTATTLRHHFRERLGIAPAAYRQRFKVLA